MLQSRPLHYVNETGNDETGKHKCPDKTRISETFVDQSTGEASVALRSGGIEITVTIATADSEGNSVDLEQIQQAVAAVDDTALATSFGEVMGVPVAVASQPPVVATAAIEVPFLCPAGKWCTAGVPSRFEVSIPCFLPAAACT